MYEIYEKLTITKWIDKLFPPIVLGLGGTVITIATKNVSVSITGMSLASLFGIILDLVLPQERKQ